MSLLALARTRLAEIEAARGTPRGTAVEHVERRTRIGITTQCSTVPTLGRGTVEQPSTSALVCGRSGAECLERSPLDYRDGLERLASMPVPAGVQARRWAQIVDDAALLEADWGETARALGWSDLALWGCNPDPSARRLDRDGLVMRLRGRRVFAIRGHLKVCNTDSAKWTYEERSSRSVAEGTRKGERAIALATPVRELPKEIAGEADVPPAQRRGMGEQSVGDVLAIAAHVLDSATHI